MCCSQKRYKLSYSHTILGEKIEKDFQHPSIPNKIRKSLIKDTFADEILEYAKKKDLAVKNVREISNCITRLRLQVNDSIVVYTNLLKNETGASNVVIDNDNVQVVYGLKI